MVRPILRTVYIVRAGVRAPSDTVGHWLERGGHVGGVTPGLGEATYLDLVVRTVPRSGAEDELDLERPHADLADLAAWCGTTVVSVSPDWGELFLHHVGRAGAEEVDPDRAEAILGSLELEELAAPELRFEPPHGRQVLVVTTPSRENWGIAKAVLQAGLCLVRQGDWSVVVAPDDDLLPVAHGLVAAGNESGLLISRHETSWAFQVFRRGKPRTGHLRMAGSTVRGFEQLDEEDRGELDEPTADARTVVDCIGTVEAGENVSLVRALLRREPTPESPVRLLDLLGLGSTGVLAGDVLQGTDLREHPDAETSAPSGSTLHDFLDVVAGAPLRPDRVPVVTIVYAAWLLLLVPLLVENLGDWAAGRLDGWDVAQLVGCAISIPVSLVCVVRVRHWLRLRRT